MDASLLRVQATLACTHTQLVRKLTHSSPDSSFIAETSFVRAPLNSRVASGVSHVPSVKGKERQESLEHVPIDIQEALMLEDLLYVLMVNLFYAPFRLTSCLRELREPTLHFIQTTRLKTMIRYEELGLQFPHL